MFGKDRDSKSRSSRWTASRREREAVFARRFAARAAARPERPTRQSKGFFASWDWSRIRIVSVAVVFVLLWGTLWARAYYLQVVMGPEYAAMAKRQHTAKEVVRGMRGNILDRNGNVIARSVECQSVWANPALIADRDEAAASLAEVLRMPRERLASLLGEPRRFIWLKRKVDFHTAEKVKALKIRGIYLDVESERVYPYRHLAGQLLGFVNIDDQGIEGLEKAFEEQLAGREVTHMVERDASGRRMMAPGSGNLVNLRGRDVRLTIDTQVQFFAEESLAENVEKFGARWGGCIVVDVPSGDVLAWAQYPFFDPNNIAATPAPDRRNRLAMDGLEQGSTIKSFLIAAALQEKVVTPETTIYCEKGKWKLGRATLHDTHSYANLTVDKILHVSSNIGAAKIGLKLGAERYYRYLKALGFGERTGLPLAGEVKGILRPAGRWAEIDLATASFGQSFSTTLAQMAQAYLCLAGGGVKKPLRLKMDDAVECRVGVLPDAPVAPVEEGERLFSSETMREVRDMLREVVEEEGGTGKQARIPGMVVGGKTGTAQKADKSGKYGKGRVGSFVGMIPIENPRYLICVLLDEPTAVQYGGVIAAPVFRHVALHTMAYHGLLPDTDDPLVQAVARKEEERKSGAGAKAAAKKGSGSASAANTANAAEAAGGREKARSAASLVLGGGRQDATKTDAQANAAAGSVVGPQAGPDQSARTAGAAFETGASRVPPVVGMGIRSAVEVFAGHGVVPVFKGRGNHVVRQTPEAGSDWPDGKKECTLWLEERTS